MDTHQSVTKADTDLRNAVSAFERSTAAAPEARASAVSALIGLVRALADLTRFAMTVAFVSDPNDPIHLQPRILRAL